jgi:cobyrinic acid a,c-diamide synthase
VAAAKVGPDFIDPGYHALATGRPGRNLDPWMCGESVIPPLAARAAAGCDVLIVEGVMGLFDGAGATQVSSTAHVARLLEAPVVLVVDASALSSSVAAVVHGFDTYDPTVTVAGVVLNRVGSDHHESILRHALAAVGVPVLGALHRDERLAWRDRHLGLVPVVEQPEQIRVSLELLADAVAAQIDLGLVRQLAATARRRLVPDPPTATTGGKCRVAVAGGPAFSFGYPDNLELLGQAGAELVPFDPLRDPALPEGVDALVAGGGFPEVFVEALAANHRLLAEIRRRVGQGMVTWAECGGLLWLGRRLGGHRLCGAVTAEGRMTRSLTLGYRTATFQRPNPLGAAGTVVRGHEFHYSTVSPSGDGLRLEGPSGVSASGWASPHLLASYLHLHLAGTPQLATELIRTVVAQRLVRGGAEG